MEGITAIARQEEQPSLYSPATAGRQPHRSEQQSGQQRTEAIAHLE
jgi:hypothetical protein